MESVTQLAYSVLEKDQLLIAQCSTPEDVLDYLLNEENFRSLSSLLIETMVKAGACSASDPQPRFAQELYRLLAEQDAECGKAGVRSDMTVKRWISGQTKSIRYRKDAMEICFALGLEADQAGEFLRKCGFNGFNVRDAEDATYLYCLLNNLPLSAAKRIIDEFMKTAPANASGAQPEHWDSHSGHTTLLLKNQLLGNWENDEAFLDTFLIPNKAKFLGFSLTSIRAYYILKNCLFLTALIDMISDEDYLEAQRNRFKKNVESSESDPDIRKEDIPFSLAIRSAIVKFGSSSVLFEAGQKLVGKAATPKETLQAVRKLVSAHADDIVAQKEISSFLNDVIKTEGLLKHVVYSIRNRDGRIRPFRDSSLNNTVMREFPDDKTFAKFEDDPSIIYEGRATRKAIVLMYYIVYAYEFPLYLSDFQYTSGLFDDIAKALNIPDDDGFDDFKQMGFAEFYQSMNTILDYCQLPRLYPANQFDWLILRSIREIEIVESIADGERALEFFNEVLQYSFGDEIADE